jgi:2-polyprenyl-3-methyl-5-hydroxy-6-metoxy-1,4-benzoquinol methylase
MVGKLIETLPPSCEQPAKNIQASVSDEPKPEAYYQNIRQDILPLIPPDAEVILDVGCGAGRTGEELKKMRGVFVAGIEQNSQAADLARKVLDDVEVGNIEAVNIPYNEGSFDCIIFADILEHLVDPLSALKKIIPCMKPDGTLIASIPNVQYFAVIHQLVEGNWTYQKEGILDNTHLRIFTLKEIRKLFDQAVLNILEVEETLSPLYKDKIQPGKTELTLGRITIRDLSPEEIRRFFVFQYKIIARHKKIEPPQDAMATSENLEACPEDRPLNDALNERMDQREDAVSLLIQAVQKIAAECNDGKNTGPKIHSHKNTEEGGAEFLKKRKLLDATGKQKTGEYEEAVRLYGHIRKAFPDCLEALIGESQCHGELGDFTREEECLSQALIIEPRNPEILLSLGQLKINRGQPDLAIDKLFEAISMKPDDARIFSGLGDAYRLKGGKGEAIHCYLRAYELNMKSDSALKKISVLACNLQWREECELQVKKLSRKHPGQASLKACLENIIQSKEASTLNEGRSARSREDTSKWIQWTHTETADPIQ